LWGNGQPGFQFSHIPSNNTTYTVTGFDYIKRCSSTKTIKVTVSNCQGISDVEPANSLSIYPNPCSGNLFIEVAEPAHFSIYTIAGNPIFYDFFYEGKRDLNVSFLPNGIYLIEYKTRSKSQRIKLIKVSG
jgi:hypothetical protein